MAWIQKLGQAALGWTAGNLLQSQLGGSTTQPISPSPNSSSTPADRPQTYPQVYRGEQQSNEYYPPQGSFPSVPVHASGAVLSSMLPDPLLDASVNRYTNPSNPESSSNRQQDPALIAAASMFVPGPLGMVLRAGSSMFAGAEHQAHQQAQDTPRQPPNPEVVNDPVQIQAAYGQQAQQYAEAGYMPQSRVMRPLGASPTPQNAQISNAIQRRLLTDQPSPFLQPSSSSQSAQPSHSVDE